MLSRRLNCEFVLDKLSNDCGFCKVGAENTGTWKLEIDDVEVELGLTKGPKVEGSILLKYFINRTTLPLFHESKDWLELFVFFCCLDVWEGLDESAVNLKF